MNNKEIIEQLLAGSETERAAIRDLMVEAATALEAAGAENKSLSIAASLASTFQDQCVKAYEQIDGLKAANVRLKTSWATMAQVSKQAADLNDRLAAELDLALGTIESRDRNIEQVVAENRRLAAELAEINAQKPIGMVIGKGVIRWKNSSPAKGVELYAAPVAQPFQHRVSPWMQACFGEAISSDRAERNHRFLEESLELVQACGCTQSEARQLVDYVFGRPVGETSQEVGGVMVTLAALCLAQQVDMHACGETELARIWTKVDAIRAKQAAKPKHSPLPQVSQPAQVRELSDEEIRALYYEAMAGWMSLETNNPYLKFARAVIAACKGGK